MKHENTNKLVDLHLYNKGYPDHNIVIPCKWVDFFTIDGKGTEVVFCDVHGKEQRTSISNVVTIVSHME